MSLDSHSRFAVGWDTYLVSVCEELQYHGFDAPCLTGLPLGFEIEQSLDAWTKSKADSNAVTYQWSDHLEFVSNRTDVVRATWSYLYQKLNMLDSMQASSLIKNIDPINAWKILSSGMAMGEAVPSSNTQNFHPIIGKGSTEVMLLGYLLSGIPHYQGQFLPEYNRRLQAFKDDADHPCARVVHAASQAYKIAGGFVFLPSPLAKSIEFSTYFKSDDELLPSMRLIRSGAKLFTPNWNVVYHWYGRAGLPRPGWTQEVYDTSINAMHNELGFLGFSYRWYDKANKPTATDNIHLKDCGFELNENDVVLAIQDGVRAYPAMSKSDYYDKVGFHRNMMVELQLMEFSSKAELTDIDLVYEESKNGKTVHYVRPFYVFSENMATLADTGELEGNVKSIEVQLVDKFGTTVGSRNDLTLTRNPAGQKNIQILNTRSVKLVTTVFCHPAKNIPVDLIVSVVKTNNLRLTFITSELFTAAFRKHVIDMSLYIP